MHHDQLLKALLVSGRITFTTFSEQFLMILKLDKTEFYASCSRTYGQSLIQIWKKNLKVY